MQSETFCYMIDRLHATGTIGKHPDFAQTALSLTPPTEER